MILKFYFVMKRQCVRSKTTGQILALLKLNQELNLTIVITHEMQVVKEICNKVAVMEKWLRCRIKRYCFDF